MAARSGQDGLDESTHIGQPFIRFLAEFLAEMLERIFAMRSGGVGNASFYEQGRLLWSGEAGDCPQ